MSCSSHFRGSLGMITSSLAVKRCVRRGAAGLAVAAALQTATAAAQLDVRSFKTADTLTSDGLSVGAQSIATNQTGSFDFAGHSLTADGFSGLVAYSSDAAVVAVANGTVRFNGETIGAGQAIILPPLGVDPAIVRYDAKRLIAEWTEAQKSNFPSVFNKFQRIAKKQSRAIFWGRLAPTTINIAAPGSAEEEQARRSVVGADVITQIRYQANQDAGDIESGIVSAFLAALKSEDEAAVAALLDPSPFGRMDMRGQPSQARMLLAKRLINQRNWATALGNSAAIVSDDTWYAGPDKNVTLKLKRLGDFAFVETINVGTGR